MNENIREIEPAESAPAAKEENKESLGSFAWFCVKLVIIVLIFRSFFFTSFNIPSESMMPRLLVGDYLFAAKWPYGYSYRSLPFNAPLLPESRILADTPDPGDIVIFEHPIDGSDYIKRVVGVPGDTIQLVNGVLHINEQPVGFEQVEDFVLPIRPDGRCRYARFAAREDDGTFVCRYPQFRETLPNGVSYNILDFGLEPQDVTAPVVVPEGHLFLMGDNRDNSLDSRFPAEAGRGIGLVPVDNVVAKASLMYFSTDGNAEWVKPWTWFTAARWSRMFRGI
ncbi:signal peptidase I [Alteraurantiacibacter aquimixticola]|uniref:Signal peptidase I n=1 Tax=Alteraurantiacibacter aquimixticola TaxID=2489173 RepID=A0A4T3F584_9SPHN|nr:signal peptidase I [Alteraurantiacibacter aquimixticola]TIX52011.1 signal peptidase I [Alteraurantiacibacter aquimixticola]